MKKLLISILSILIICGGVFALAACGGGEPTRYNINFIVDGEVYATVETVGDAIVEMPASPTREGYTFDGWYYDNGSFEMPFNEGSLIEAPVFESFDVYAKWTAGNGIAYKVEHYLENIDKNGYELAEAVTLTGKSVSGA